MRKCSSNGKNVKLLRINLHIDGGKRGGKNKTHTHTRTNQPEKNDRNQFMHDILQHHLTRYIIYQHPYNHH